MKTDTLTTMGQRMAEIRRRHNVTQEMLADMLNVSPKHISHCENATSYLSLKNLIKFSQLFDCSLDYLILGNSNNAVSSKLPDEIVQILAAGTDDEIELLNRYLQIYVDLHSFAADRHNN